VSFPLTPETHQARAAAILEQLTKLGRPATIPELHSILAPGMDRSILYNVLHRMRDQGVILMERVRATRMGTNGSPPRYHVRLPGVEAVAPLADQELLLELPASELRVWRSHYRQVCYALRQLGMGGHRQLSELETQGSLSPLPRPRWSQLIDRLIAAGAAEWSSPTVLVPHARKLQQLWDDEEKFCALLDWPAPHATHVHLLLNGGTLAEEAAAVMDLQPVFGIVLLSDRTGLSAYALRELASCAGLGAELLQQAQARALNAHMTAALSRVPVEERSALLDTIVAQGLSAQEVAERGSSDPDSAALDEPEDEAPDSEPRRIADWPTPAGASTQPLLEAILKLTYGVASELAAVRRKVDWLSAQLGCPEEP
jgi:hypothetical protein